MWAEGVVEGKYKRRSLKTKSWERAVLSARKMEEAAEAEPASKDEAVTIARAVREYLADAKAREFAPDTLYKLEIIFRKQFLAWCKAEGYKLLREFDLRAAPSFRTSDRWRFSEEEEAGTHDGLLLVLHSRRLDHQQSNHQSGQGTGKKSHYLPWILPPCRCGNLYLPSTVTCQLP